MPLEISTCFLATGKLPADLRKELAAKVKAGELSHLKKEGLKPEAFFVPKFIWMAHKQRVEHAEKMKNICSQILA